MRQAAPSDAGFALPAVLVVIGMLSLVFLTAAGALDALNRQAREVRGRLDFEQAALSAEARAAWFAATEPFGPAALLIGGPRADSQGALDRPRTPVELHLDSRAYRFGEGRQALTVSVQDAAGQINLNLTSGDVRTRLLAALGVSPEGAPALADRWADALDHDGLKRLHGAEAAEYDAAGLARPADGPLSRVAQIRGVLGWDQAVRRDAWARLRDDLTVEPVSPAINVNTASPAALALLLGLDQRQIRIALARRASAPFLGMADFTQVVGPIVSDAEGAYTRPNGRFALKAVDPARALVFRARIVLTPRHPERPFWIEERSVSAATGDERARPRPDAPVFPDPTR